MPQAGPILTTFGMDVGLPAQRRAIFDRVDLSAAGVGQLTMLAIQNQDVIMGERERHPPDSPGEI